MHLRDNYYIIESYNCYIFISLILSAVIEISSIYSVVT